MRLPCVVEHVGILEMEARQRANAMVPEELFLVQHARQDAPQFRFVYDCQHPAAGHTGLSGQMHVGGELGVAAHEQPGTFPKSRQFREDVLFEDRDRGQRQKSYDRPHLESRCGPVRKPQDVIEEAILPIPHFIVAFANPVHRACDGKCVMEEFLDELLVQRFVQSELTAIRSICWLKNTIHAVPSAWSRYPPVGSGEERSNTPMLSSPKKPPSNTLAPARSSRLTHQVKLISSLENAYLRNSMSPLPPRLARSIR